MLFEIYSKVYKTAVISVVKMKQVKWRRKEKFVVKKITANKTRSIDSDPFNPELHGYQYIIFHHLQ